MARPRKYITKTEAAALLKVSPGRLSQMIARGMPVRPDGRIDRTAAEAWRAANIRQGGRRRGPRPKVAATAAEVVAAPETAGPAAGQESLTDALARKERANADLRELEVRRQAGVLVEAAAVEVQWAEVGTFVRNEILELPNRIANRLPDEWRREAARVVREESRRALTTISRKFLTEGGAV